MTAAIECQALHFAYGSRTALAGVSLESEPGRILGLLGPNGSGKSTLLQILATLLRPASGTAKLFGHDVVREQRGARRCLGVVFQQRSLDGLLTVRENLVTAGALYGLHGKDLGDKIDAMLARFSLGDRRDERVKTLSGGLARRVELAKALLPSPRLLLLDEPSTGLDPRARRDFWQTVRAAVSETGLTVVASTHLGEEAEHCDALALMAGGKIVAEGTPDGLKRSLGHDVVRLRGPSSETLRAQIQGSELVDDEVRVHGDAALLVELVQKFGAQVSSATLQRPTLEDVFVSITGASLVQ